VAEWLQRKLLQLGIPAWVLVVCGTLLTLLHVWQDTEFIAGKISSTGRIPAVLADIIASPYTALVFLIVGFALLYFKGYLVRQNVSQKSLVIELTDEPGFIEKGWGAEEDLLNRMTRNRIADMGAVPSHVYKIAVRNTTSQTIKNVSVRLLDMEGCPDLNGRLPTHLRWTDYRFTKPFQRFVDLPPDDARYFVDVVRTEFDVHHKTVPRAVVCHVVDEIIGEIPVEARKIKIQVSGENVASETKLFSFTSRDGEQKLRIEDS
jgi:hypothetical protein